MNPRRASTAALLGGALEYYDFFVYGAAAALVFNVLFFPAGNPTVALIASFATFAVGYVARPVGAVVMGHFGDRLGRKRVMLATVVLMGVASFIIGCLPTYAQVGMLAPILLVLLRIVQGFSAGAESAGASTLTVEHSPVGRRGFFTSFVIPGPMGWLPVAVFGAIASGIAGIAVIGLRETSKTPTEMLGDPDWAKLTDRAHSAEDSDARRTLQMQS